ncbi:hypothetical protein [uncultured Thiodictyon sp.]|uniref:hypothetical protein n=1 Tax=uncultured Thiodictyon sp. TaxID=1846217 RepID=UPI0025F94BDE|nr:hypothetical protein [uncultured Thiodictyon sp.]
MTKQIALTLIALAGLTLGACGPSEAPPKPPEAALGETPKPVTSTAPGALSKPPAQIPGATSRALPPPPGLSPALLERARQAREAAKEAGQAAKEAGRAAEAQLRTATQGLVEKGRGLTATTGTQAALLIPQIKGAIAANQPGLAKTLMARLESIQGSLPPGLKLEVARIRALLAGMQQTPIPASAPAPTPRSASAVHHAPAPPPAGRPAAQ